MSIAYLVNQYPKVSHSFIRREILALEALGLTIHRFAIRSCEAELVDPLDVKELQKTTVVLSRGMAPLILAFLRCSLRQPLRTWETLLLTLRLSFKSESGMLKHFAYLCEACSLLVDFQARQVQHVHSHFGTNSTTVAMLCHKLGGPTYSFTVHGPEEFDKPKAIGLTEKINHAASVFAISSFTRSQLYRWCDYPNWEKIKIIRCGLDSQFLQSKPAPIPEAPRLVCVGRLCEQKGTLLLVKAAQQLRNRGYQFKLVLVGDGDMRPEVEQMIE
jgi:glycosyltransferase involved in cell wall biosynthesis